jgi:ribosomal 50S subunit-recycling heat shock protein
VKRHSEQLTVSSSLDSIRLDLFLKLSRIIPRRTLAREVCEHGGILVNGHPAKSGRPVRVGDLVEWRQRHKTIAVRIAQIPAVQPRKQEAAVLYELVRTE